MHKNPQNQKSQESQESEITSFNETALDPMAIAVLDELDDTSLAAVLGGAFCPGYICGTNN